jgi:hypothetical protein
MYLVITKEFYTRAVGEVMTPISNYGTKDIARY